MEGGGEPNWLVATATLMTTLLRASADHVLKTEFRKAPRQLPQMETPLPTHMPLHLQQQLKWHGESSLSGSSPELNWIPISRKEAKLPFVKAQCTRCHKQLVNRLKASAVSVLASRNVPPETHIYTYLRVQLGNNFLICLNDTPRTSF